MNEVAREDARTAGATDDPKAVTHTPGPWRYGDCNDGNFRIYAPQGLGEQSGPVAEAMHRYDIEERRANARLIAAAPDLLEAVLGVLRVADRATVEFDAARAAIAKAEGR